MLFEVVVVNGPSTDGTTELLREYVGQIKIVSCPTRNLSESRNLGLAAAVGDVIVFIDDDALPGDIDWLMRFLTAFEMDTETKLGAVGGTVWHRDTIFTEFDGGLTSDYGFQIFHRNDGGLRKYENRWVAGVRGTNCSFSRLALITIGGFDEFYTYYLDETDVCWRLHHAGFSIHYMPGNSVRHYSAPAEHRDSIYDRDWCTITRSDTYFALKNGSDPLPQRLFKTLAFAPRKHFFIEINNFWRDGHISVWRWQFFLFQWARGLINGLWAGLTRPRKLGNITSPPPPFLPFKPPRPECRLRVALLSQAIPGQPNNGGIGRYTMDLARGLHERGHEVHILCKDEQPLRRESLNFLIHGIPPDAYAPKSVYGDNPVLNKNLNYALAVMRKLQDLYLQGIEFDVIHASNWDAEALALIRAQIYPVALMLISPLAQVISTEGWEVTDDLKTCMAVDGWQIKHADAVCIPSNGVMKAYEEKMGINPEQLKRLRLTPLGILPTLHQNEKQTVRKKCRLLFTGRLEYRKGIHVLLQILPELLPQFPDWDCQIVGSDSPGQESFARKFLSQFRGARWLKRVHFHGFVSDDQLWQHYQDCDLFVAPSLFESFGLIYHEAMQFGKPVIGCRTGGVPEVVKDGVEGILVAPGNAEELRDALTLLMGDRALLQTMGDAGIRRIQRENNYRTMAERLEEIYYELIDEIGDERRARRIQLWSRYVPLFQESDQVKFNGRWQIREASPGKRYRQGEAGASMLFDVNSSTDLRITALRHAWSGILEIKTDEMHQYIDLFKPGEMQEEYIVDIQLQGDLGRTTAVEFRVHSERNPTSRASQVWLKQIEAIEKSIDDGKAR